MLAEERRTIVLERERAHAQRELADGGRARFLVDGMLVKLGRYLRCLGYDTTWDLGKPTLALIRSADGDERVFLTRNGHVGLGLPAPRDFRILASDDPVEQLQEVVRAFRLDPKLHLFSRCVRCNVELEPLTAEDVERRGVPERVRTSYRRFYGCPRCAATFWKGTHVRNTCRKLGLPDASEG